MFQSVEDRQQKRQPAVLVGGRIQDGARGGGAWAAPIFVKGGERGECEWQRAVRPDDIARQGAVIGYQEAVARALTRQHEVATGFGLRFHEDGELAKRRFKPLATFC